MANCPKNFSFEFKPLEFSSLILSKSSINPKTPKPKDTKINVHIKTFFKSAQRSVLEIIQIIIISPPIVGVPDFFII